MKRLIYADNAATTKMSPLAYESMSEYLLDSYGNASQPYSFARRPKQALYESRCIIAKSIGASPDEIFFTSCGTESDNWVLSSFKNKGIITSAIEHHAVLNPCKTFEGEGCDVQYLAVDKYGVVTPNTLENSVFRVGGLVSIMYANNEIGTIQDIQTLSSIAHAKGCYFHTDAVQAVGHIKIDVNELGVDYLSASAHKFNGPKGVGFLYVRNGSPLYRMIHGGSQERSMRAGTENVASIVAMAVALQENLDNLDRNQTHVQSLVSTFLDGFASSNLDFVRNGTNQIPGNVNISFNGANGEMLLHRLDLMGICVSTGSACDSKNTQISHVLKAISLDPKYAEGTIRISFGKENSFEDASDISSAIIKILNS